MRLPWLRVPLSYEHLLVARHRAGAWLAPQQPAPDSEHPDESKQVQLPRLDELELIEAESGGLVYWGVRGDFTGVYLESRVIYEDNVLCRLLEDAKQARAVIDVGANIGLIALPVARALLPGGKVYCLDISQRNCRLLLANARRNGIDNVVVYPIGADDAFGGFTVAIEPGSTLQTLSRIGHDCLKAVEMCFVSPLDAIFADGEKIDILKVDTDGYEYRVLLGAQRLLRDHRPIIYLEYCPVDSMKQIGVPGTIILEMIESYGYRPTILHRDRPPQEIGAGVQMVDIVNQLWQCAHGAGDTHLDIRWS